MKKRMPMAAYILIAMLLGILDGRADLECGSTTSNLERKKLVDFSPVIFVAGTKLLVKRARQCDRSAICPDAR